MIPSINNPVNDGILINNNPIPLCPLIVLANPKIINGNNDNNPIIAKFSIFYLI